jgi:hypothetical protein
MLSAVILSVVVPFVRHTVVMLSVLMYSVMLTVTMRYHYAHCSYAVDVMVTVAIHYVFLLNVVMLSVVAPFVWQQGLRRKGCKISSAGFLSGWPRKRHTLILGTIL